MVQRAGLKLMGCSLLSVEPAECLLGLQSLQSERQGVFPTSATASPPKHLCKEATIHYFDACKIISWQKKKTQVFEESPKAGSNPSTNESDLVKQSVPQRACH
jgi:hypothetical protein